VLSRLNWLDFVLIMIIAGSIISSFRAGFSREVIRLASALAALVLGIWFYGVAGSLIAPYVSSRGVANFLGFLAVFFSVLIAGSIVSFTVGKVMKMTGFSWLDRLMGAAFGFARGAVVAVALVMAFVTFAPGAHGASLPDSVIYSRVAPYVVEAARVVTAVAPRELKDQFSKQYERAKQTWKDTVDKTGN
jgi:membrane protein required for colicin V production